MQRKLHSCLAYFGSIKNCFNFRYRTNLTSGLTQEQAAMLLEANGPNCLVPSKPKSKWLIFAENMFVGIATLLWGGAILSFIGFGIHAVKYPEHIDYDHLYIGMKLSH